MTGIISEGSKRLVIVSGRAHPELAQAVAKELGTDVLSSSAYDFANGETYVRFNESVAVTCSASSLTATALTTGLWSS